MNVTRKIIGLLTEEHSLWEDQAELVSDFMVLSFIMPKVHNLDLHLKGADSIVHWRAH